MRTVTSVAGPSPFAKALAKPDTSRSSANIMRRLFDGSRLWFQLRVLLQYIVWLLNSNVMVTVVCFVAVDCLAPEQQRLAKGMPRGS